MNTYKRDDKPADFDWLADIKGYSAYMLASDYAGCASPDSFESPGAVMLTELRDEIVAAWEAGHTFDLDSDRDDIDHAMALADRTLSVYSHPIMQQFVDVCAYRETSPFSVDGTWGPGTFEDMARQALGEVLDRMAMALVTEIRTTWNGLECSDCNGTWADCCDGCVNAPETDAAPADESTRGPGADQVTQAAGEAAGHLSDPLYALLVAKPSETQTFLANMARINDEEFANRAKRRRVWRWVLISLGLVAYVAAVFLAMGGGK